MYTYRSEILQVGTKFFSDKANEQDARELDELLIKTAAEQSETETVKNVTVRSTVNVSQTMNMKMYTVVVVVVFFMVGCVGSIVVGRVLDILDYKFYVDPLTKLPNRRSVISGTISNIMRGVCENGVSIAIGDIDFFKNVNVCFNGFCGSFFSRSRFLFFFFLE